MSQIVQQSGATASALAQEVAEISNRAAPARGFRANGILFHATKRGIDLVVAMCALLTTGPVILIGALAVKLNSQGPVFYRARRAGLRGQPFIMFKLRTMHVGADSLDRKITEDEDERVTVMGRWLRKFKIDELPQFWNVLRGDMSIVGPRPEDWDLVQQHYTPAQRRSLEVRPGIASPVDVDWYPDLTYHDPAPPGVPMQEHYLQRHLPMQVTEAMRYADRQTLWLDVQVIVRLVFCVLVRSWLPPQRRPLPTEPVQDGPRQAQHPGEN
jgi:lipopolysaccharide/colanic/teichoic acid biosynthesis glycosyltransferase